MTHVDTTVEADRINEQLYHPDQPALVKLRNLGGVSILVAMIATGGSINPGADVRDVFGGIGDLLRSSGSELLGVGSSTETEVDLPEGVVLNFDK